MQKSKISVWGSLQIAVKRREVKSKGEKQRYKHLNAEFQRIARRDKKAFFSNQCKEIEENNRMGKTTRQRLAEWILKQDPYICYLQETHLKPKDTYRVKVKDWKKIFHAKMGSIKDRNGMDLTEAEDIKKRWQEYTEKTVQKRSSRPR